jgi:hypothetical protein
LNQVLKDEDISEVIPPWIYRVYRVSASGFIVFPNHGFILIYWVSAMDL